LTQLPDLSLLPEPERNIIAKALAKQPQDRWASCRAFVEKLLDRGTPSGSQGSDPVSPDQESPPAPPHPTGGPGLETLRSVAKVTDRIWPLVVEETEDQSGCKRYSVRVLGPPRAGAQQPIRLGSRVLWSILWGQEAHLLLLDEDPEGKVFCLC